MVDIHEFAQELCDLAANATCQYLINGNLL